MRYNICFLLYRNLLYNSSDNIVSYDGNTHGIIINITSPVNAKIRYMDEAGNYTLETMPEYKEIGTYIIKYRIYINNNYNDVFGENTLTIKETNIQNNSTDYEGMYDGEAHSINIDINVDNYIIKYSVDMGDE